MDNVVEIDSNHGIARFAPDEAALRKAAEEGYRSVVNFRTTDEKQEVAPDEERRIVEETGLSYLHHPVSPDALDDELVDDFRRSLDDLPQPVLLHCASGKRAGAMTLMALAADRGIDGEAAIEMGREKGLDLSQEKIGQFAKDYADRKSGK
ncbi:beta-lactamase hydrolase domain-containing protein (plasmid) [Limimaricola variabilis]|uniref:beta-lactamase hydrolase domain-containing protein n=1 Tax=Limimaricola variabilis TaxID=1492771 RepID=UPI002AC8C943|nr:sulfur transferase domain-containing protein [Limimaricola variabilis]WPY96982.1 sulfur transferase domain-containing protein [Limimaricola variabilis]